VRTPLALLAALLVAVTLAACGDDDGGAADTTAPAADGAVYPVTVEHAHGTTTLEARPERIVSLNVQWTDAVLALGVEPVAYVLDAAVGETAPYPWHADRLEGVTRVDMDGTIPFERIAALQPDLILVTYLAEEAAAFDTLADIAPTIGLLGDLQVDPWQDQVEVLGDVLGEPARAEAAIAEVDGEIAALADGLPGLRGKTYVAANYVAGDGIYVVADPEDGASRLFYGLGMEIDPEILALDEGAVGRVQLSLEQAGLLDADLLGILTNGDDPAALPGWDQLPSVRQGSVVDFELADVVGLNTPTPLSIPHVIELLRPALEVVAAAG
jgi:iron complex transport system substrate-binding protein